MSNSQMLLAGAGLVVVGYLIACWRVAAARKCSTLQIVRETLTIQGAGGPGEER